MREIHTFGTLLKRFQPSFPPCGGDGGVDGGGVQYDAIPNRVIFATNPFPFVDRPPAAFIHVSEAPVYLQPLLVLSALLQFRKSGEEAGLCGHPTPTFSRVYLTDKILNALPLLFRHPLPLSPRKGGGYSSTRRITSSCGIGSAHPGQASSSQLSMSSRISSSPHFLHT